MAESRRPPRVENIVILSDRSVTILGMAVGYHVAVRVPSLSVKADGAPLARSRPLRGLHEAVTKDKKVRLSSWRWRIRMFLNPAHPGLRRGEGEA